jgi:hypothetical protein
VDAKVLADLAVIRDALVPVAPSASLVLVGGFGRGEGSVLRVAGAGPRPLNDYDVLVIALSGLDRQALAALRSPLAATLGLPFLDLIAVAHSSIPRRRASQFNLDCGAGSFVFHGAADAMAAWPRFSAADLPVAEGLLTLRNRTVAVLEAFRSDFLNRAPGDEAALALAIQGARATVAAADAALIQARSYEPFYARRPAAFTRAFPREAVFAAALERACEFKLRPRLPVPFDPVGAWREAVDFYLWSLDRALQALLGAGSWQQLAGRFASPWRAANLPTTARDLIRLVAGRRPAAWQGRQLELAGWELIRAGPETPPGSAALAAAGGHLAASGAQTPVPGTWDSLREAVVRHWYTIRH